VIKAAATGEGRGECRVDFTSLVLPSVRYQLQDVVTP
jgi:hypothetical protein